MERLVELVARGEDGNGIGALIDEVKKIEDPARRYESQDIIMGQVVDTSDALGDSIDTFYQWMKADRAYESQGTLEDFEERHKQAEVIAKASRERRNKLLEATTKLKERWGEEVLPALKETLGGGAPNKYPRATSASTSWQSYVIGWYHDDEQIHIQQVVCLGNV